MQVKLMEAKAVPDTALWGSWDHARFTIAVENLDFQKEVMVHLADGREYPARYVEPLGCHYEVWECAIPLKQRDPNFKFAVRYSVSGQTYWDNNDGQDYVIAPSQRQPVSCTHAGLA
jgi:hypothetical protein